MDVFCGFLRELLHVSSAHEHRCGFGHYPTEKSLPVFVHLTSFVFNLCAFGLIYVHSCIFCINQKKTTVRISLLIFTTYCSKLLIAHWYLVIYTESSDNKQNKRTNSI